VVDLSFKQFAALKQPCRPLRAGTTDKRAILTCAPRPQHISAEHIANLPGNPAPGRPSANGAGCPVHVTGLTHYLIIMPYLVATKRHFGRNQSRFDLSPSVWSGWLWQNGLEVNCLFRNRETVAICSVMVEFAPRITTSRSFSADITPRKEEKYE
jgi:hypothetical protein